MIEFVGSLELKCSWKWKVAKIMSNFMESFTCPCEAAKWLARSLAGPTRELGDVRTCGLLVQIL